MVVRGEMALAADIQCSRCSEFFSTSIGVSDFLRAYPVPEGTNEVDITEDMREDCSSCRLFLCAQMRVWECVQCGEFKPRSV